MNAKRLLAAIGLVLVAAGAAYYYLLAREKERIKAAQAIPPPPTAPPKRTRPWRWPTESEWVVHQVAREIASWAAFARGEDAKGMTLKVRRTGSAEDVGTYAVEVSRGTDSRKLAVEPREYVWSPAAYVPLAKELLGPEGGRSGPPVTAVEPMLLASETASLRRADTELFTALSKEPRDPRLHEQAALLWAAHALRETDGRFTDARPFVNGIVAHLALAQALRGDGVSGEDAELSGIVLDALLYRQSTAMEALDRLAGAGPSGNREAWTTGIRLRITNDPRLVPGRRDASRLEKLESLRALRHSRGCRAAVEQARSWRLPRSADWVRAVEPNCLDPEASDLTAGALQLQVSDAAQLADLRPGPVGEILASLGVAALANDHQPSRPLAVVPAYVRADAGASHVVSALLQTSRYMARRSLPQEMQMFAATTEAIRASLPQRPVVDLLVEEAADIKRPETCERVARLIADRPDYLPFHHWTSIRRCKSHPLLAMTDELEWTGTLTPGTGRTGFDPWSAGRAISSELPEARRRAPWAVDLATRYLESTFHREPPAKEILSAYQKVLDYDVSAMKAALGLLHDDDDEAQHLAERICETDVEQCARYADYLASLDREEAAERMWKRALAKSSDRINLSNELGQYVNILFDRGDAREAQRVAKVASDVYSQAGLFILGNLYERQGRFPEAAAQYAKITSRYEEKSDENAFYIRYRQRQGGELFREQTARALAEVFPAGLARRTLAEFQADGLYRGGAYQGPERLTTKLRRFGVREADIVVVIDGFTVLSYAQMDAILTFTDDPKMSVVVYRPGLKEGRGFTEISGRYRRWKYGPAKGRAYAGAGGP
jgi:tetratricopeptide (TPR) repeat protein